jgi:hypothetical protein
MSSGNRKPRRSALLSFRFLGTAVIGSLAMALVSVFAPLPAQVAVLGALVSIMAGLFLSYLEQENERERRWAELLEKVRVPVELAPEHELFDHYSAYSEALTELAKQTDPILRASALLKLSSITEQVEALAEGRLVFASTEAWRTLYEQLLRSPDIKKYCSVAWVKTKDYWQDQPGRQSMSVNFEAAHRGTLIERIIILRDTLWPRGDLLPSPDIRPWIEEQHSHGLWITLVRESDVASEPDLLADVGIYGDRAVGVQELDERSRTVRFILCFDQPSIRLAQDRWRRLAVYAVPFRDLLDQLPPGA